MGQVITEPRTGDTPGPGTRGARRLDEEIGRERRGGLPWRLLAVAVGVALAVTLWWVLGARDTDPGTVISASDEAAAIADEKGAILARGVVGAVTSANEATTDQQEKEQLVATDTVSRSTATDDGVLQDEKAELTARRTGRHPVNVAPTSPTEQAEKELLIAG